MTGRVVRLPEAVANQIAAGEVVERPASVVKELVENALDADAKRVRVEVEAGGVERVRVVDDGHGMSEADARLCLERHATSKIRTAEDLTTVRTLGFRGEAIPSIASVSRFTMVTRARGADVGTELLVEGGHLRSVVEAGAAEGTSIDVCDLFYNVPARRKFLKRPATEMSHITDAIVRLALARRDRAFTLTHGGREVLDIPPEAPSDPIGRVRRILGKRAGDHLYAIPDDGMDWAIRVTGFVSSPEHSERTARGIYTFVNGRFVRDRTIQHAITDAYRTIMERGRHPVVVLYIDLDPNALDVNVHPQKTEVRFARTSDVHRAVSGTLRRTLTAQPWLEAGRYGGGVAGSGAGAGWGGASASGSGSASGSAAGSAASPSSSSAATGTAFGSALRAGAGSAGARGPVADAASRGAVASSQAAAPGSADAARALHDASSTGSADAARALHDASRTGYTDAHRDPSRGDPAGWPAPGRAGGASFGRDGASAYGGAHGARLARAFGQRGGPRPELRPPSMSEAFAFDGATPERQVHFGALEPVGQVLSTYLVCQGPDRMVVIDQHAAHERIAFEQMRTQRRAKALQVQPLLVPLSIELDPARAAIAETEGERLAELGVQLEPFGGATWVVKSCPVALGTVRLETLVLDLLDELKEVDQTTPYEERIEALLSCAACHTVVRAGDRLTNAEIKALLVQMDTIDFGAHCPHGRPVFVEFEASSLAKMFHRS